jgi:hypothetical protein
MAALARQLLQQQAHRMRIVRSQQQPRGQLLGLGEIAFQGTAQVRATQVDQALVPLTALGMADGDRHHRLGQRGKIERRRQRLVPAGETAQTAALGALGEQQPQGAAALEFDRQRAFELDVAGEQRAGGQRLAEQLAQRLRITGAAGHRMPGRPQSHQRTTHAGALQQETVQYVFTQSRFQGLSILMLAGADRWGLSASAAMAMLAAIFP